MAKNIDDWKAALALATGFEPTTDDTDGAGARPVPARRKRQGVVFSTDENYVYSVDDDHGAATLPRPQQRMRVSMERAGRGGKTVTLVRGFVGSGADLEELGRSLRKRCGVGGSVRLYNEDADTSKGIGEIIVQGDHRQRVVEMLKADGYSQTK